MDVQLGNDKAAIVFSDEGIRLVMPNPDDMGDDIGQHIIYAVALFHMLSNDEDLKTYVSDKTIEMLDDFRARREEQENDDEGLSE